MRGIGLAASGLLGTALGAGRALAAPPHDWQMGLQEAATPVKEAMDSFHDLLLVITALICLLVLALLAYVIRRFAASRNPTPSRTAHNTLVEVLWTAVPVLVLVVIAIPSFRLLYYADRTEDPELTLEVKGYQWNWGYAYPDQQIAEFTSNLVPEEELGEGQLRLLSVDRPVLLPVDTTVQVLVTAGDVLHSWAVPSFGLKTDAIPGRMHEAWVRATREGVYYGQCSELCGTGHGYMPIEVHVVSREAFDDWVVEQTAHLDLREPPKLLTRSWEDAVAERRLAEAAR
jgi:cytochrome c oxidase subunit 2